MATRSKISSLLLEQIYDCDVWFDLPLTNEFRMLMARLEIPVSGWTCLRTKDDKIRQCSMKVKLCYSRSGVADCYRVGLGLYVVDHAWQAKRIARPSRHGREMEVTHPCKCKKSMSPCGPWFASSSRQWKQSSCQHPSSQGPWRQRGPWRRASCQQLWEAL